MDYNGVDLNLSIFNHETTSANEGEYIDQTIVINSRVSFANDRPSGNILTAPSVDAGNLNDIWIADISHSRAILSLLVST